MINAISRLTAIALASLALTLPAKAEDDSRWGPARDDLDRFYGLYGTPGDENGRNYFIARAQPPYGSDMKIPDGHMMMGAMWGDVAPWYFKSEGDTRFRRPGWNEYNPDIVIEFETGPDGQAEALIFIEVRYEERERLERVGDLPQDWQ